MTRLRFTIGAILVLTPASSAVAWDPWGDITNPGRIVRNVGRELENAGRTIDRTRLEIMANAGAPALQLWIEQSRNTASAGAMPIPPAMRQALTGFIDNAILDRARFKIGDPGVINLANNSIQYGNAQAVTLDNIIVFKNGAQAYNDPGLWAHELAHVRQFRDWGIRDFSIRYLRSWNGVENEAYDVQRNFAQWYAGRYNVQRNASVAFTPPVNMPPPVMFPYMAPGMFNTPVAPIMPQPQMARVCMSQAGVCPMPPGFAVNTPCGCPTPWGPAPGMTR